MARAAATRSKSRFIARTIKGAKPLGVMPGFVPPMLATMHGKVPKGDRWLYELKFDGWRVQAHILRGGVTVFTRGGHDWTKKFSGIAECLKHFPAERMILDGEVVSADVETGRSNFSQLQADIKSGRKDRLAYYVFDLLYLDGFDLRGSPLVERRRILENFLKEVKDSGNVLLSEEFDDGAALFKQACSLDLEGIIAKRRDAPYRSDRGDDWLKVKCVKREEFYIVGFVPGPGGLSRIRLGRKVDGKLIYCGRVGTGWNAATMRELRRKLEKMQVAKCPLDVPIRKPGTVWVKPTLKAKIAHTELTDDGMVRHPSFKGLAS